MRRKIKILFIHHGKGIGGAPISLLFTIKGIMNDYEPEVLFIHNSDVIKKFNEIGIKTSIDKTMLDIGHTEVSSYNPLSPLFLFRLLYQPISFIKFYLFIIKNDAKIVHLNTSSLISFAIAAKLAGRKVVMHVREPLAEGTIGFRKKILKELIFHFTDAVIPISEYDASKLKPSSTITVVHNFVDFEYFDKNIKCSKYSNLKRQKMILHLGGISTIKGTEVLIKSLKFVKKKIKDFTCVIAGVDKDRTGFIKWKMQREIQENSLENNVIFQPPILDPAELMACSDVVVFPSTRPHFARPIIEASAMAKPVVASALGGPKELVIDGETGFLVPENNPQKLGEAIADILSNKKLAISMGKKGYELAWKKFELKKNTEKIKQVYAKLLNY